MDPFIYISIAFSILGMFITAYCLWRETKRLDWRAFANWNPTKQYFAVCSLIEIPNQFQAVMMVGQCHGEQSILKLSEAENDLLCRITGVLGAVGACAVISVFGFAISFRYKRLLMVLEGSRHNLIMQTVRWSITGLLFILSILFTLASCTKEGPSIAIDLASERPTEIRVLQICMLVFAALALLMIVPSDLYCTYAM